MLRWPFLALTVCGIGASWHELPARGLTGPPRCTRCSALFPSNREPDIWLRRLAQAERLAAEKRAELQKQSARPTVDGGGSFKLVVSPSFASDGISELVPQLTGSAAAGGSDFTEHASERTEEMEQRTARSGLERRATRFAHICSHLRSWASLRRDLRRDSSACKD